MSITRRTALGALASGVATAVLPGRAAARDRARPDTATKAVLYDSTRCIGCRECIRGCAEANDWDGALAFEGDPVLTDECPTVLRRFVLGDRDAFRKVQCMHCVDAPCVSACMLGAMGKDEDGAVTWNGDLCVGCRYCQIACPFNAPRFEWDTPVPRLLKCEMCPERRARGLPPACVEQCRRGALEFGTRREMLDEAHRRIAADPDAYNPKVYGERDGGGTGFLYLAPAEASFADLGFPDLPEESSAVLPETIQHSLYRGMVAPLALFAFLGAVVNRNARRLHEEEAEHHSTHRPTPVGGRLVTWPTVILAVLALMGGAVIVWRYLAGLGATTNLSDGYPMGLWIVFDVVTGTALACGGYAMALLVYVANRGRYHPLVRPALLTSAFGYSLGGFSVLVDLGRPWNFYRIPFFFWEWNFTSILLEVALCIMLYTTVLWIEVSPAILEGWRDSRFPRVRRVARTWGPRIERALPWFIALGLLLPTMHQSSLGSMMLLAGYKLHPLWHTPLLPLLFLVSCVAMGYAAVTLECCISARVFKRPRETPMLRALAVPVSATLVLYAVLRVTDLWYRGRLGLVAAMDGYSVLFLAEMALLLLPALILLVRRQRAGSARFLTAAVMVAGGGALYRFSTFLFAFNPGEGWSYFPAVPEFMVTVGLVAAEILGYVILVKLFPILRGAPSDSATLPEDHVPDAPASPEPRAPAFPVLPSQEPIHVPSEG